MSDTKRGDATDNARLHDWTEDFPHRDGRYECKCSRCNTFFLGHKRRITCKVCGDDHQKKWNTLTDEQKQERYARLEEFNAIFNQHIDKP